MSEKVQIKDQNVGKRIIEWSQRLKTSVKIKAFLFLKCFIFEMIHFQSDFKSASIEQTQVTCMKPNILAQENA